MSYKIECELIKGIESSQYFAMQVDEYTDISSRSVFLPQGVGKWRLTTGTGRKPQNKTKM
jgi:hypothetical protein